MVSEQQSLEIESLWQLPISIQILKFVGLCKKIRKPTIEKSSSDGFYQDKIAYIQGRMLKSINQLLNPPLTSLSFWENWYLTLLYRWPEYGSHITIVNYNHIETHMFKNLESRTLQ